MKPSRERQPPGRSERGAPAGRRPTPLCPLDRLTTDRGVAALHDGQTVAVFRLAGDELYAIDHVDPASGAPVLARGLVGSAQGAPFVASPLHKQRYDLRTGRCLDDPALSVRCWYVRVTDGVVVVDGPVVADGAVAGPPATASA